jgi:hypothetical protein
MKPEKEQKLRDWTKEFGGYIEKHSDGFKIKKSRDTDRHIWATSSTTKTDIELYLTGGRS